MDPATAIGVASGIISFISFSTKLVAGAIKIHESVDGALDDDRSRTAVANELRLFSARLVPPNSSQLSEEEKSLCLLAKECGVLSDRLINLLDKVKPKDVKSKSQSLWAALKSAVSESEKSSLQNMLSNCRAQLEIQLIFFSSRGMKESLATLIRSAKDDGTRLDTIRSSIDQLNSSVEAAVKASHLHAKAQDQVAELLQTSSIMFAQQQILGGLFFDSMRGRQEMVTDAHDNTFRWIYESENSDGEANDQGLEDDSDSSDTSSEFSHISSPEYESSGDENEGSHVLMTASDERILAVREDARAMFVTWLQEGSGIFHISGKLGCGKSTMMKYLSGHPRTMECLRRWAGNRKLVFAKFFFWKPGTPLQKSVFGLCRTLLYDILEQCPELIPSTLPSSWDIVNRKTFAWQAHVPLEIPEKEIVSALTRLSNCINEDTTDSHRFCFFIDGLDEYQTTSIIDHKDMVQLLQSWATPQSEAIKICVSSREHNVYMNAFSGPRLRLHDLTRLDLEAYVASKLDHASYLKGFSNLVKELVRGSGGIFQWVVIVVRSIREEIENGVDDVATLVEFLHTLPDELDDLYQHILITLPPGVRRKAYRSLDMVSFAERHKLLITAAAYSLFENYDRDNDYIMSDTFLAITIAQTPVSKRDHLGQKLLRGRCGGLLECISKRYFFELEPGSRPTRRLTLCFTHRSIPDFLDKYKKERQEIAAHLEGFDALDASSQMILADARLFGDQSTFRMGLTELLELRRQQGLESPPFRFLNSLEVLAAEKDPSVFCNPHNIVALNLVSHDNPRYATSSPLAMWVGKNGPEDLAQGVAHDIYSPLYTCASEGEFDFLLWKLRNDPTTANTFHKIAMLGAASFRIPLRKSMTDSCWSGYFTFLELLTEKERALPWEEACDSTAAAGYMIYGRSLAMRRVSTEFTGPAVFGRLNLWRIFLCDVFLYTEEPPDGCGKMMAWFLRHGADPRWSVKIIRSTTTNRQKDLYKVAMHFGSDSNATTIQSYKNVGAKYRWEKQDFTSLGSWVKATNMDEGVKNEILELLPEDEQGGEERILELVEGEPVEASVKGTPSGAGEVVAIPENKSKAFDATATKWVGNTAALSSIYLFLFVLIVSFLWGSHEALEFVICLFRHDTSGCQSG
ncbi:hypothetical protein B0T16DRAFT_192572 [Cercophora newfieldiana]|uniref:NACHT domain-containing protein n=1 Tax=Cercophora newfieldiana TaxID=92897 RepID=A0AA40CMP2_9PEZI|nr:hypothetical protein B0T16DRAFT_192572 [Cercophora newfieldiana]